MSIQLCRHRSFVLGYLAGLFMQHLSMIDCELHRCRRFLSLRSGTLHSLVHNCEGMTLPVPRPSMTFSFVAHHLWNLIVRRPRQNG